MQDGDRAVALSIRLSLEETERRSASSGYADRVITILLAGVSVESALGLAIGHPLNKFEDSLNEVGSKHGPLASRAAGSRVWRTRSQLQHAGLLPDIEGSQAAARDARTFATEVLFVTKGIDLNTVSIADALSLPALKLAVTAVEEAMTPEFGQKAAEWMARLWVRLRLTAGSVAHRRDRFRSPPHLDSRELQDWLRRLQDQLSDVVIREVLGLTTTDVYRLDLMLRGAHVDINGNERVWKDWDAPTDQTQLRWAWATMVAAALRIDQTNTPLAPLENAHWVPTVIARDDSGG
jgi:hypothetical protein